MQAPLQALVIRVQGSRKSTRTIQAMLLAAEHGHSDATPSAGEANYHGPSCGVAPTLESIIRGHEKSR